jgi:hypothetical protein
MYVKNTLTDPWWMCGVRTRYWLMAYKRNGPWKLISKDIALIIARFIYNQPLDLHKLLIYYPKWDTFSYDNLRENWFSTKHYKYKIWGGACKYCKRMIIRRANFTHWELTNILETYSFCKFCQLKIK